MSAGNEVFNKKGISSYVNESCVKMESKWSQNVSEVFDENEGENRVKLVSGWFVFLEFLII